MSKEESVNNDYNSMGEHLKRLNNYTIIQYDEEFVIIKLSENNYVQYQIGKDETVLNIWKVYPEVKDETLSFNSIIDVV